MAHKLIFDDGLDAIHSSEYNSDSGYKDAFEKALDWEDMDDGVWED